MMDSSLSLRIGAIFILFFASLSGLSIPLVGGENALKGLLPHLQACSAGVMLALALLHLAVDANGQLAEYVPNYPLGYALMAFGVYLTLSVEHIAISLVEKYKQKSHNAPNSTNDVEMGKLDPAVIKPVTDNVPTAVADPQQQHQHDHNHDEQALDDLLAAKTLQDLVVAYALEMSISVHSIIIGVNLGLYTQSEYNKLTAYLVALVFHQFSEGIGMGVVLRSNRNNFGQAKLLTFILIFCFSISLGVVIGILTSSQTQSDSQIVVKAVVSAIAGGALLYSSLAELTSKCFNNPELHGELGMKLGMLLSFGFGLAALALIAYWA